MQMIEHMNVTTKFKIAQELWDKGIEDIQIMLDGGMIKCELREISHYHHKFKTHFRIHSWINEIHYEWFATEDYIDKAKDLSKIWIMNYIRSF